MKKLLVATLIIFLMNLILNIVLLSTDTQVSAFNALCGWSCALLGILRETGIWRK